MQPQLTVRHTAAAAAATATADTFTSSTEREKQDKRSKRELATKKEINYSRISHVQILDISCTLSCTTTDAVLDGCVILFLLSVLS